MSKYFLMVLCAVALLLAGCSLSKESMVKLRDMEFTVVDDEEIPKEFLKDIEEKVEKPMKLTYADGGSLYIAVGYGEQKSSGYSIEVKELYETENVIYIHTNLIGPSNDEKVAERKTFPYIVVKTEYVEKNVVFQ